MKKIYVHISISPFLCKHWRTQNFKIIYLFYFDELWMEWTHCLSCASKATDFVRACVCLNTLGRTQWLYCISFSIFRVCACLTIKKWMTSSTSQRIYTEDDANTFPQHSTTHGRCVVCDFWSEWKRYFLICFYFLFTALYELTLKA